MRVYCRFAPPCRPVKTEMEHDRPDAHVSFLPPPLLLLSLRGETGGGQQTVTLADPRTGSMASSRCRRVFLPEYMSPGANSSPFSGTHSLPCKAGGKSQQEEVFDELVRPLLRDMISGTLCTFIAYGQTATGKTYTMFGPNVDGVDNAPLPQQQEIGITTTPIQPNACEQEEGIVPRLLRAIFEAPGAAEQQTAAVRVVDLSCMEVHNECVTDLAALLLQQQRSKRTDKSTKRNGKSGAICEDTDGDVAWRAWRRYEQQGRRAEEHPNAWDSTFVLKMWDVPVNTETVPIKVMYKATEKKNVMRSVLRLRCESAAECCALLRGLLALRFRGQTERNVCSSRSHLVLRLVFYGAAEAAASIGEALFVDLAGSESYRINAQTAGDVSLEHNSSTRHPLPLQVWPTDTSLAASDFTSNIRDGSGLTVAQRSALHTNEMRHINVSLLALRKVVRALHTASSLSSLSSVRHIPFRDSTLTTILEPFLISGGKSVVTWVVCCSCKQCDFHETVESLRLGAEASATTTCVQLYPPIQPASVIHTGDGSVTGSSRSGSGEAFDGVKKAPYIRNVSEAATASTGAVIPRGRGKRSLTSTVSSSGMSMGGHFKPTSDVDMEGSKGMEGGGEEELEAYKQYALQLIGQCNTLCESYDACVEELARTKQALALRDCEIARLQEALAEMRRPQQLLEGPPSLPPSSSTQPVKADENNPPEPPAWLRRGAMCSTKKDMSSLLSGISAAPDAAHSVISRDALDAVVDDGAAAAAAAKKEPETDWLSKSTLKHYCIQDDPTLIACQTPGTPLRDTESHTLLISSSFPTNTTNTTMNVDAIVPLDSDSAMQTPSEMERNSSIVLKNQNHREHIVSFVSPSSHGAVPLMQLVKNIDSQRILPPRPSRSALCTRLKASEGNHQSEDVVKTAERTSYGMNTDNNVKILRQLLLRGADLFGGALQKHTVAEDEKEELEERKRDCGYV
ncbi:kinesin, putative [Trypanosoma cruzi marinkellei]|uniref:Kinesin, putative n=1 Tax=Trypanosoma cruzi marinkellei TaxID=85056 RepID=K2NPZ1_TRYCR|nr:kinesin, putative [Trypanosoma cruzi marinkellei]